MTPARGEDWGAPGPLPPEGVVVASDREARRVVEEARRAGREIPPVGLVGGDLGRALGARADPDRLRRPDATRVRIDVARVVLADGDAAEAEPGERYWFVAHLVARRRGWLAGPLAAVMNTEWLGSWRVAPRAHPGDGRLDLLTAELGWRDRLAARRRLPAGDHLPHPGIRASTFADTRAIDLGGRVPVRLDGERVGVAARVVVAVEPAALLVVV